VRVLSRRAPPAGQRVGLSPEDPAADSPHGEYTFKESLRPVSPIDGVMPRFSDAARAGTAQPPRPIPFW